MAIFLFLILLAGICSTDLSGTHKYVIISMPGSGTHQLFKCLSLMHYGVYPSAHDKECRVQVSPHTIYTEERAQEYLKNGYKILCNIRDPRDRVISYAKVYKIHENKGISLSDAALKMLKKCKNYYFPTGGNDIRITTFADQYSYYLPWLDLPDILTVRFEDLIGPSGGSNVLLQRKTIKKIAEFLDIDILEDRLTFIVKNLFGGTQSFRNAKIGQWKKHFTEKHYEIFQETGLEEVTRHLGYGV